ncbi:DUF6387 family protein [Litorilituus lipolyticus]|uniref:Uncharacterized protein n=1 Tax=Litorilituus lipolyticus TaxID=2491017 RepID=A0A502L3D2_9GAMM|nr:DUF6387 family protein [Litorilituus lipolyticus]TPH17694.1 hypothetical protein EPA86_03845 [Litorilituus lipolyticus]
MYLLEVRAKIGDTNLQYNLPNGFSLNLYRETESYSAETWLIVLSQRAALLNSIVKFNEINFTKWVDTFSVSKARLGLSVCFQTEKFICPPLDSPILTPSINDSQNTYEKLGNFDEIEKALHSRRNSVISINHQANPDTIIKELTHFIKRESLWCKSINKVSGKRTRGFYGPDKTYERIKPTRFKRIVNKHNFDELISYQVLAYIDLTLYALICNKKYGNKYMDSLLFPKENEGNIQTKKVERVTQNLANAVLMHQFLSDLASSTNTSPQ